MYNYGTVLKKIRTDKNFTQKDIYKNIMTRQSYYLLESNKVIPAFNTFLQILEKLLITTEEFLALADLENFPSITHLYSELNESVSKKDTNSLHRLDEKSHYFYLKTKNTKYFHLNLITKAMIQLQLDDRNFTLNTEMDQLMSPIKDFLFGIDSWHFYELNLLNNSLYCFSIDEAISLALLVVDKSENLDSLVTSQKIKLTIYINLSFLCLKHNRYEDTKIFSSYAKENSQINHYLLEKIIANLNYQISKSVLTTQNKDHEINKYLNLLETLDYHNIVQDYRVLISKHLP